MENKIEECHQILQEIYEKAEILLKELKILNWDATLASYNNHYLKIKNKSARSL